MQLNAYSSYICIYMHQYLYAYIHIYLYVFIIIQAHNSCREKVIFSRALFKQQLGLHYGN